MVVLDYESSTHVFSVWVCGDVSMDTFVLVD